MSTRRAVITGLGIVSALGQKVDEFWRRMIAGESGVHKLSILDTAAHKVHFGGDIPNFDPAGYVDGREMKRIDRFAQFALVAAIDAVTDSGIDFSKESPFRCGVILGSGIGGFTEVDEQSEKLIKQGPARVSAMTIPKLIINAGGAHIAIKYGMRGVNTTVATACASAANAVNDALLAIRHGGCDVMITGGAEAAITHLSLAGFANMKALSTRNDEPGRASRPWDKDRDGFVMAEGAGIVVVEELEHAKARGARIYCELLGTGATCDGGHITAPDENGAGAAEAMRQALASAKLNPTDVGYVNAHGTSTELGDKAETRAIKAVFGEHAKKLSISSNKSQLGHSLGASGGIELVASVKTLTQGIIPPTLNLENPDPECDLDYTPLKARERRVDNIVSNSFGFGGHNAVVVIGKVK